MRRGLFLAIIILGYLTWPSLGKCATPSSIPALRQPPNPAGNDEIIVHFDYIEQGQLKGGVSTLPSPRTRSVRVQADDYPSEWPVTTLVDNGPSWNRVDIVFVGDGYTASELDSYASQVSSIVSGFFAEGPFASYEPYFNVHRVDVVSNESGVDEPDQAVYRDTALDAAFGESGNDRLLYVDTGKAIAAAGNAPEADLVVVVGNTARHGGAAYVGSDLVTVAGSTPWAVAIAMHESGHTLAGLADEYDYADGTVYTGSEPSEANVSIYDAAEQAALATKWYQWLDYSGVGTYEGAYYHQYGVYRPTDTSLMRSLDQPFGPVNGEQLIISFYRWVWPIDDATPSYYKPYPSDTVFYVTPLEPTSHFLDVQWSVDWTEIPGATGVTFEPSSLSAGIHIVTVRVTDDTTSVRDEGARQSKMTETREWQVESGGATEEPDLYDGGEIARGFSPWTVDAGQSGQSFSVYCDIKNGGGASAGSFTVRFYASTDSTISGSDYYIGDASVSSLPADGRVDCDWSGDFPTDVPSGTYYIGWVIDADDDVSEANENNNAAYKQGYQLTVAAIERHTLTVSSTAGGSVLTPGEGPFQYDHGASVTITATAASNYRFVSWTGTAVTAGKVANPGAASTTLTIDADYTVQANFEASAPVTTSPAATTMEATNIGQNTATLQGRVLDDGGEVCECRFRYRRPWGTYAYTAWTGAKTSGEFFSAYVSSLAAGSSYIFSAQARNSVGESQWGSERTFTTLAAVTEYTLTISSTDGGAVTSPGEGSFSYVSGSAVPIRAAADSGYDFATWTGTAVTAGRVANPSAADTTLTIDADYAVRATFAAKIQASVTLLYPLGGEILIAGDTCTIRWQTQGSIDRIAIEYSTDNGSTWQQVAGLKGSLGSYPWLVPSVVSDQCLVRISASDRPEVADTSGAPFGIHETTACTWYVDASAAGNGDGTSWRTAFIYVQDALTKARAGDEIWVAQGTYWPDLGRGRILGDRTETFQLQDAVAVYGGFPSAGGDWEQRDPRAYETILSGDIGTTGVESDNSYHVVTCSDTDETTALDGFTITGGFADGDHAHERSGAGMYNLRGSPAVGNCTFFYNSAIAEGGGIANQQGTPTFLNCVFIGNLAGSGGGAANTQSNVTFINCAFSGNAADSFGGGMYSNAGNDVLINCTLSANTAHEAGGGIHNERGATILFNCIVWGSGHPPGDRFAEAAQISGDRPSAINCCCVQGWTETLGGSGNFDADPLFMDAKGPDNVPGTADDDLRLETGSPCTNAGDNASVPADVTADLDGEPRMANGNVDMGAYESQRVPGLVAHWKLDETQGTLVQDSAGDNHGKAYGASARSGPSWQPAGGRVDGALECDGLDDYVVNETIVGLLNGLDALTVALWVKSDVINTDRGFIHFEDPHGTDDRGMRYDAQGASGQGRNVIKIGTTLSATGAREPGRQQLESSRNVQTTEWQHLAMIWSSGQPLKLYINGTLDTPTFNHQGLVGVLTGYTKVIIGRGGKYGSPSTDARGWDGLIDDVRIYSRALSPQDIRQLAGRDVTGR